MSENPEGGLSSSISCTTEWSKPIHAYGEHTDPDWSSCAWSWIRKETKRRPLADASVQRCMNSLGGRVHNRDARSLFGTQKQCEGTERMESNVNFMPLWNSDARIGMVQTSAPKTGVTIGRKDTDTRDDDKSFERTNGKCNNKESSYCILGTQYSDDFLTQKEISRGTIDSSYSSTSWDRGKELGGVPCSEEIGEALDRINSLANSLQESIIMSHKSKESGAVLKKLNGHDVAYRKSIPDEFFETTSGGPSRMKNMVHRIFSWRTPKADSRIGNEKDENSAWSLFKGEFQDL